MGCESKADSSPRSARYWKQSTSQLETSTFILQPSMVSTKDTIREKTEDGMRDTKMYMKSIQSYRKKKRDQMKTSFY